MLRILKDCRLCGVSVHAGETFPLCDFDDADVQILLGAGYAERFTPPVREASAEPSAERNVPATAQVEAPPQARAARAQKKKTKK